MCQSSLFDSQDLSRGPVEDVAQGFGGSWTLRKLDVLRDYLDAYTTVMKNQGWARLSYVDPFAGSGSWSDKSGCSHDGSARISLDVSGRPFDRFLFIDLKRKNYHALCAIRDANPHRDICVQGGDANEGVISFCSSMTSSDRAVVFLDPFGAQVSLAALKAVAATEKVDCFILVPVSTLGRMMPLNKFPDPKKASSLDRVFGGREFWASIYSTKFGMFDFPDHPFRKRGRKHESVAWSLYCDRLRSVFPDFGEFSVSLFNVKKSEMFRLAFVATNPRAVNLAVKIVGGIISRHSVPVPVSPPAPVPSPSALQISFEI